MTKDQCVLSLVEDYKFLLLTESLQNSSPKTITVEQELKDTNRQRSKMNVGKGVYYPSLSPGRGVLEPYSSSGENRWGEQTGN